MHSSNPKFSKISGGSSPRTIYSSLSIASRCLVHALNWEDLPFPSYCNWEENAFWKARLGANRDIILTYLGKIHNQTISSLKCFIGSLDSPKKVYSSICLGFGAISILILASGIAHGKSISRLPLGLQSIIGGAK